MTNPPQNSTTAFAGAPLLESAAELKAAIDSGDWAAGALAATGAGLDALGAAMDPFGTILSHGVGWLMEHVGPLKEGLDALAGDPGQISANAETWRTVGADLAEISADLTAMAVADTPSWSGQAAFAYRERTADTAQLLVASKNAAEGAASGVRIAGELVAAVRELVRDIIAELVGRLISWALQALATLGIGLTWVVPQVARAVASTAVKIAEVTGRVVKALGKLVPLLKRAGDVFGEASTALRHVDAGSVTPSHALDDLPTRPSATTTLPPAGGGHDLSPSTPSTTDSPVPSGTGGTLPAGSGTTTPSSAPKTRSLKDRGNPAEHDVPVADRTVCADPIDVATGWMVLTQDDVEFAGVLPFAVSRTHISSYRFGRLFGPSWASTLDQRLEAEPDGLHLALADGSLLTFPVPAGDAPVFPETGPRLRLWRDEDGYVVGDPATERLLFFGGGDGRTMPLRALGDGDGNHVVIGYDAVGLPAELRHSGGYRLLVETADGLVTALRLPGVETPLVRYAYDARRRLTEVVDGRGVPTTFTYDADGRIVRWEDCAGRWYRYGFDALGRCVRAEGTGGYLDCTLEYDRENRVTLLTDSLGGTTRYRLDERLRVVAETDPLGHTSTVDLDEYGRVLGRTDALGRTTKYELDEAGNVVRVTRPDGGVAVSEYDERGRPVLRTGPDGAVWRREYDPRGKLVRTVDPLGAVTEYGYDEAGTIAVVTDALGGVTRFENNAAGLPVAVTDPLGAVTRYEYDEFGRVATITDPLGAVTRMRWSPGGDLRERVGPDGAAWRWTDADSGAAEEAVDARGLVSRTEFGPFDLPVAETGPDGHRLGYAYDTELRLVAVTNEDGLVWRYTYDAAGRLDAETDFNGRTTRYGYDAAGDLVRIERGDGESVRLDRDVLGRVVTRRAGPDVAVFAYDGADRLISARNDVAEVDFTLDPLGRVVAESVNGRVVRSEYDALGRRTVRWTPSGGHAVVTYDAAGHPVALRTGARVLRFTYDRGGRELSRRFGHSELRQWWDPQDRLLGQAVLAGERTTQRREYAYLPDGHLAAVTDALSGPRALEVDVTGRVCAVSGPAWREDYAYTASGALAHAGWPAGPDAAVGPRRYQGTLLTAAGDTVYRHDALGRTVERQRHGRIWRYHWNSDDRLTSVGTPDGVRWVYRYDALGRRIAKLRLDGNGQVAERIGFTWDGTDLAEERYATTTVVWDREPGGRPIAQTERWATGDRFHTIVTDLVGTPAELVDEAGEVAWHPRTTLWGKVADEPSRAWTPLRFPGQYHDRETGLHYNFHRYYDPETGRYLTHDPLGLSPAPDSLAYVANPTRQVDPLGLTGVTPCQASGSGGGKRPPQSNPGLPPGSSGPQPPKRAKTSYDDGTHGAKGREQKRLTDLFDNRLRAPGGPSKQKVSGDTHQSEHPIGYEVLGRGSAAKRGAGEQQKLLENHAPAYQEELRSHREHIGTGTSSRTAPSGFTAQSYRDSQRNALEAGDPNTALQLNQLDYAHQPAFKDSTGKLGGDIADDSYHNMVDKSVGKGVTYAKGPGANETTPPLSAHDARELHAAREAARTGKFPEHKTFEEELEEIHNRAYQKPTAKDWEALERGNYEKPVYDSDTD